jgi:hypothetical protein
MNMTMERFKRMLTIAGERIPSRPILDLQMVLNYLRLGRWMRDHGFSTPRRLVTREDCWDAVAREVGDLPILYLEFGVFQGRSLRYWSELLKHPDARLHGFDSFEGLPETFDLRMGMDRSVHDLGGQMPEMEDSRVILHKGWFDEVLPQFSALPGSQWVVSALSGPSAAQCRHARHRAVSPCVGS